MMIAKTAATVEPKTTINGIQVIRKMERALYAFTCGEVTIKKKAAIDDGEGYVRLPVPAYLFVHPDGNVLFDTGLHAELEDPDSERLGALAKYSKVGLAGSQHILSHLGRLGLSAGDIRFVVNSHLHYDHCGGNSCFPNATLVVNLKEWEAAHDPRLLARAGYNPIDYDLGTPMLAVDGEYDLFADGSFVLFPTPGHTPGHQSVRVSIGRSRIVLAADVCYLKENYDRKTVSRLSFDREDAMRSLLLLHDLERQGWDVPIPHDERVWSGIPQSPTPLAKG